MKFQLQHTDPKTNARAGLIHNRPLTGETPNSWLWAPCSVRRSHQRAKEDLGAQIILGNTITFISTGLEILQQAGGLHHFNGWNKPMLTDSGGFQVFSLTDNRKLSEEGAEFQSHIDGSRHFFTPEKVIDIQRIIGADIMMAFDECTRRCGRCYPKNPCSHGNGGSTVVWSFAETVPIRHGQSLFPHCTGLCLPRPEAQGSRKRGFEKCGRHAMAVLRWVNHRRCTKWWSW